MASCRQTTTTCTCATARSGRRRRGRSHRWGLMAVRRSGPPDSSFNRWAKMRPDPRDFMMLVTPLLLAAAMLVTGCTPDAARWTPVEAPKQNKVELVAMPHQVRFAPNGAALANGEEKALADFLGGIEHNYGDQITIDAGPHSGNAAADALAAKRIDTVAAMLRKLGVRAQVASRPSVDGALAR